MQKLRAIVRSFLIFIGINKFSRCFQFGKAGITAFCPTQSSLLYVFCKKKKNGGLLETHRNRHMTDGMIAFFPFGTL